jgi:hypothetical protein
MFAPGVSLKHGIENACESVEKLSGVDMRQRPIKINIDCLGNVILQERPQEVSEGAGPTSQYEIVAYLKRRGLYRIAERVGEELGLEDIDDLKRVKREEIGQLEWLKPQQKNKLLELVVEETASLMSADDSDAASVKSSVASQSSTRYAQSESSLDVKRRESFRIERDSLESKSSLITLTLNLKSLWQQEMMIVPTIRCT